jgi:ATP-dependent RNA helicase HelY
VTIPGPYRPGGRRKTPRTRKQGASPRRSGPAPKRREPEPIKPGADNRLRKVFSAIGVPEQRPFVPDAFQLEAISAIKTGDCLVTAPTGAGKTWIAEQAIARIYNRGGRAWYACPLKALSNAKHAEFSQIFGAENVGILTGDRKENTDAPIIVGTTEILRNQLYDAMHHGTVLKTDLVILDEAHYLGDEDRGVVWEEIMIYLPPRIPLLLLSATIGNAGQIAGWLAALRAKPCHVVAETRRPVPLYPLFFHPSGTLYPLLAQKNDPAKAVLDKKVATFVSGKHLPWLAPPGRLPPFGEMLGVLRAYDLLPAIFFLKSRADCDAAIELCRQNRLPDHRKEHLIRRLEELLRQSPHVAEHRQIYHIAHLGVASHHSGQLPAWKLVIETLMTQGLLDAVFATSTVAAGVNFPARTILFFNSDRFNGRDFSPLTATEFHQMTGRAGRRGMDNIGFAVTVPGKFMDTRMVARLCTAAPTDVMSQIRIDFSMVLNLLLSHSPAQVEDLLRHCFGAYLMRKKKTNQRFESMAHLNPNFLWASFNHHLELLVQEGYVTPDGILTEDGIWASQLRIDQPLLVAEGLRLGVFPDRDPALMAAVIASFVAEREFDDRMPKSLLAPALISSWFKVKDGLRPFAHQMIDAGFPVRPLFLRPAAAIHAWASEQSWEKSLQLAELAEGDLAMLILRTADNLRHIRSLDAFFPDAARSAGRAIQRMLRDPVITEFSG